jgi:glycosyltransferase involved in cell wall biosynthesis
MPDAPLISIVTAAYNAAPGLPYTMRSIFAQTWHDYEWIVIDGGSTDGTVDLLKQYQDMPLYWISEKDRGIYDAWNKACRIARGQWLIFLGAGDELASTSVLEEISEILRPAYPTYDVVYGKIEIISEYNRTSIQFIDRPWAKIKDQWEIYRPSLPMHPETFQHRSLCDSDEPFDLRFRYCADSHFLLRAFLKKPPLYVPILISRMPVGGVSNQPKNLVPVMREIWAINADLGIKPPTLHRIVASCRFSLKLLIGLLPPMAFRFVMDCFRILRGRKRRWSLR